MRNLVKGLIVLGLGFALVAIPCIDPALAASTEKPIKIGFIHSMSGAMSMYGISSEAGAKIAIKEINTAGGVLGRKLD